MEQEGKREIFKLAFLLFERGFDGRVLGAKINERHERKRKLWDCVRRVQIPIGMLVSLRFRKTERGDNEKKQKGQNCGQKSRK